MRQMKQSTARSVMAFMVDSTDHVSAKTGLTLTITASKAGAAFASISPTVNDRGSGWYEIQLTTAHTDTLGDLALHITSAGADPTDMAMEIVAYDPQNAVRLGLTAMPNATAGASGGLATIDASLRTLANVDAWRGTQPATLNNTLVQSDVERWINVVPLGLTSQRVNALMGAITAGLIDATAAPNLNAAITSRAVAGDQMNLVNDAITDAKIAAGAITSSEAPALANLDATVSSRSIAGDAMALTAAAVDAVWDEVLTKATHNVPSSAGRRVRQLSSAASAFDGTINGTPSASIIPLDATASTTNDFYKPGLIIVESSFGVQFARVNSYNGAAREITVATPFTIVPNNGDTVTIIPWASVRVSDIDTTVLDAIADALHDEVVEGALTLRQTIRILLASAAGAVTVAGAVRTFKSQNGLTDRISGTEDDDGQRTGVTVNGG